MGVPCPCRLGFANVRLLVRTCRKPRWAGLKTQTRSSVHGKAMHAGRFTSDSPDSSRLFRKKGHTQRGLSHSRCPEGGPHDRDFVYAHQVNTAIAAQNNREAESRVVVVGIYLKGLRYAGIDIYLRMKSRNVGQRSASHLLVEEIRPQGNDFATFT